MTRRSSPAVACALLLAAALLGAVGPARAAPDDAPLAALAAIDAQRAGLRATVRPLQGYAAEGTRVTAYRRAGRTVKIEVEMLGERSRRLQEYYWSGGALIGARLRIGDVDTEAAVLPVQELLLLGRNGGLRRWELDGQPQALQGRAAGERAVTLRAEAASFRRFVALPEPARACLWSCADRQGDACARFVCE